MLLCSVCVVLVVGLLVLWLLAWGDETQTIAQSFVINLPQRTDRWTHVRRELYTLPRLTRVDGVVVPGGTQQAAEQGCALAHRNVLRRIAQQPRPAWYGVFEDDACPVQRDALYRDVQEQLRRLPRTAWALNVGPCWDGYNVAGHRVSSSPEVRRGWSTCLHAYFVTPQGAAQVIDRNLTRRVPCDQALRRDKTFLSRAYTLYTPHLRFGGLVIQDRKTYGSNIRTLDHRDRPPAS